jgi:hypothetical protein
MSHTRIFFWRYLAWGAILVLAFGPAVGFVLMFLAYWPVRRSAIRTARRLTEEIDRKAAWHARHFAPRSAPVDLDAWRHHAGAYESPRFPHSPVDNG